MEISGMKILKSELEDVLRKDDDLLVDLVNEINAIDNSLMHLEFFENYIYDFEEKFETKEDLWFALRGGKYSFDDEYIQINQYNNIDSYSFVEVISMMHDDMDNILNMYLENYNSIDGFEKLENVVGSYYMKKKSIDNIMSNGKYYNIYFDGKDDYIIKSMKREKNLVYTNSETGVAELEISFNIVSEHEEDEGENCFILEILNIRKI